MKTFQNDWIQFVPAPRKIFLLIDPLAEEALQSLDLIRVAALKGLQEAKTCFHDEYASAELELTQQSRDRASGPLFNFETPTVRLVDRNSAMNSDSFEISWRVVQALGPEALVCVFRDTFRNLMVANRSTRRTHSSLLRSLRHQIGNLLFRITARLDQAKRLSFEGDMGSLIEKMRDLISGAERSAHRAEPLLQNLAVLGGEAVRPLEEAIRPSVGEAVNRFTTVAEEWKVAVSIKGAIPRGAQCDPLLVHALWVILENALQAQLREPGGTVSVEVSESAGHLSLLVRDEGPGFDMDPNHANLGIALRAESHSGRPGLGLPASSRILNAYGARLLVRSGVGRGAEFLVELPVSI
jgi:signal transduction histidine kinase